MVRLGDEAGVRDNDFQEAVRSIAVKLIEVDGGADDAVSGRLGNVGKGGQSGEMG